MQQYRILRSRSRAFAVLCVLAVAAAMFVLVRPVAVAKPPPNPTDGQIQHAQQQKDSLAGQVGQLNARVATLTDQLHQLDAAKELAEQKMALAYQQLADAKQKATTAKQQAQQAQQGVQAAQREFVQYAQAAYMNNGVQGMTGSLLTASDPNALLQQSALEGYQADHQLGAISDLQRATVARSNADAAARLAVQNQTKAAAAAKQAEQNAVAAVHAAQAQSAQVSAELNSAKSQLNSAQSRLQTLNGERAAYIKWHQHQVALARARARRLRLERERQRRLQQEQEQQQQQQQNNGGGGSGGGYTGPPQGGSWSLARGEEAVQRAERWLGTMYAWAGGNQYGPTRGVCAGDGAFNDCNIIGFDCSGLVMYAWGPYISLAHYAATQFTQAGTWHPSPGNFQPGDLLFWSSNGTIAGIHHVAIYIGNGMVIQAPQSGSVIQETPWDQVSWGYFGATRPLT